jgi:hypothetical protein
MFFSLLAAVTSCGTTVNCSQGAPTYTIVGRLVARNGSATTFSIQSVKYAGKPLPSASAPPSLAPGQTVAVRYYRDHAKYLRVGSLYLVELYWGGDHFESDVHTAGDPCSHGTTYADGHTIDTRSWTRAHLSEILVAVAVVPIVLLAILATTLWRRRRAPGRPNGERRN